MATRLFSSFILVAMEVLLGFHISVSLATIAVARPILALIYSQELPFTGIIDTILIHDKVEGSEKCL